MGPSASGGAGGGEAKPHAVSPSLLHKPIVAATAKAPKPAARPKGAPKSQVLLAPLSAEERAAEADFVAAASLFLGAKASLFFFSL